MSLDIYQHDALECPRCGKRTLVQKSQNRYQCLWCHFQRDLSGPGLGGGDWLAPIPALVLAALIMLMLL